jgi:hypothetical protein
MSCLRYLCLFVPSGVQHILCFVFVFVFFVLLPVSLDFSFLIAPVNLASVCLTREAMTCDLLHTNEGTSRYEREHPGGTHRCPIFC